MMKRVLLITLWLLLLVFLSPVSAFADGGKVHYVQRGESLSSIAILYGVTPQAIMDANGLHNPDYVYVNQRLVIPTTGLTGQPGYGSQHGYYTVQAGDTLGTIAQRFNTTAQALVVANNLSDANAIRAGQVLNVPGGQSPNTGSSTGYGISAYNTCDRHYTVQWGDTLSGIAWQHGTTVEAISGANGMANHTIREGQRLCVPGGGSSRNMTHPPAQSGYYTVKPGDTVSGIAHKYGLSQAAIIQANHLSSAGQIYAGQKLAIPGYQAPAPAPKTTSSYHKPKVKKPPAPDYVEHEAMSAGFNCFAPLDVWTNRDYILIETIQAWCAQFDYMEDPDHMTAIVVRVKGREGAQVKVQRGNDPPFTIYTGSSPGFGPDYVWYPTSPGYYLVYVDEAEPSEVIEFDLPPGQRAWADFHLSNASKYPRPRNTKGWSAAVTRNPSELTPQNGVASVIIARGPANGLPIRISTDGEFTALCYTGQKPEHGAGACEFGGLWPGKYTLTLEGAGVSVEVFVDGVQTAEVTFDAL